MTGATLGRDRENGRLRSSDGVEIAYTVAGRADTTLAFIHGGLATPCRSPLARIGDTLVSGSWPARGQIWNGGAHAFNCDSVFADP